MRGPALLRPLATPRCAVVRDCSVAWTIACIMVPFGCTFWAAGGAACRADESIALRERIDRWVESSYVGEPAAIMGDAEFLRRVSLDLTGRIPTSDDARAFLADTSPDKREKLVDRLLSSVAFLRHITDTFDVMWMERRPDKHIPSAEWRQYLYDSFAKNKPLNVLIREILSSDGTDPALRPAAKFFLDREDADAHLLTRDIGRMFFGVDLQCAQCHDHPLIEAYKQSDYYGLFAFVNRTILFVDAKDKNKAYLGEKAEGDAKYTSAFTKQEGNTLPCLPSGEPIEDPIFAKEELYIVKPAKEVRPVPRYSRRLRLAEEATSGKNLAFNRNLANRLWAMMMGRGLVEPVDLTHPDNPPSHGELLDELARDLAAHQFDLRYFLREIALSRTYQRSIDPPGDWLRQAQIAVAQREALQEQLAKTEQAYQEVTAQLEQLERQRGELLAQLQPLRQSWRDTEQAWADADKAARDATAARDAARQAAQGQLDAHQALVAAVQSTEKAVAAASTDTEVAAALEKLRAALAKTESALQKAQAEEQEKTRACEAVVAALQEMASKRQQAQQAWQEAAQPLTALEQQIAEVRQRVRQAEIQLRTLKRRQADAQWLAEKQPDLQRWDSARQQLRDAQQRLAQLQRQHQQAEEMLAAQKAAAAVPATMSQQTSVSQETSVSPETSLSPEKSTSQEASASPQASVPPSGQSFEQPAGQPSEQPSPPTRQTAKQESDTSADLARQLTQFKEQLIEQQKVVAALEQDVQQLNAAMADSLTELENRWVRQCALAALKPLAPEQLAWSLLQATGVLANQYPAIEEEVKKKNPALAEQPEALAQEVEKAMEAKFSGVIKEFVGLYGAGPAQPQQVFFATVDQALYLTNGGTVRSWLAPSGKNLTARLLALEDPGAIAEELYLSVLTRLPDEKERRWVAEALAAQADKKAAVLQELAWALVTSVEFRFCP